MPSPIFDRNPYGQKKQGQPGSIWEVLYNRLYASNPTFRDFANQNRNRTMEDICADNGLDPNQVAHMSVSDVAALLARNGMM